ncbi:MAG: 50S ribosomal protein L11 methyltransferase [Palaeococcus sp.]|uniref:50S ribosomal protein L11 methyltransferase n=1 Tax=Palaeococcus sp. (in: euryarchaeotes) TaxID=2820298 RepID=UPI0025D1F090|nr:50S ribosomal protein L11 methyltransferase [Palaeococcus sp. (in: euryarchaeotes)]MCD6559002.1 50S ribosomal protein L11 methyltransferase [Palaeococcus sp. (in: euryarchaeotes)]
MEIEESHIKLAVELIKRGWEERKIRRELPRDTADEIIEIARARIKARDKFSRDDLWMDLSGLRYSTHEVVARYRAERLRPKSIADVSCGIGIQLIFFARYAEKAYAVDIDERKLFYAMKNAEKYGVKDKITFINGDSLKKEIVDRIDADIIFSDPARPPEMPERRLEDLLPSPVQIYEAYRHKTDAFIFDLPPQIRREKIPWKGEFEYIDLYGHLNRLTFYFEPLARAERSAVMLPKGVRLESDESLEDIVEWSTEVGRYIYEIPQSVHYADLINELFHKVRGSLKMLMREKRRILATADEEIGSEYLKAAYHVLGIVPFHPMRINDFLKREGFGRATLRISIPDREYYNFKRRVEMNLKGERRAYVFQFGNRAIITEKL